MTNGEQLLAMLEKEVEAAKRAPILRKGAAVERALYKALLLLDYLVSQSDELVRQFNENSK